MKKIIKLIALFLPLIAILSKGCKSDFNTLLPKEGFNDSTADAKTRKVLYIIVDGARGWAVRDAQAPTINSLLLNSTYTWYSLSDDLANDGVGWADLMTGVTKAKHQVVNDQFTGAQLQDYPNIAQRVKASLPSYRVASYSASEVFKTRLTTGADASQSFANDADVKAAIVTELANDNASVVVGQFSSVDDAGTQFGYTLDAAQYKTAILQFDQYLFEIMSALKSRKNYSKEDWLVVITSSHGGDAAITASQNDNTIFSIPKVNTFTILHTPSYVQKLINRPFAGNVYTGSFLRFYSAEAGNTATHARSLVAKVTNKNDLYDFGDTTSFTIELKLKKSPHRTNNNYVYDWPVFFGKRTAKTVNNQYGWAFALERNKWRFLAGSPSANHAIIDGNDFLDGNWHHLAIVSGNYTNPSGVAFRYVRLFQDGNFLRESKEWIRTGTRPLSNSAAPLTIGMIPTDINHTFDGYLSDIRIWQAALPDEVIKQFSCDTRITPNHPYWGERLIGYWPGNDGSGTVINDESLADNDFHVTVGTGTTLQWNNFSNILCPPTSSNLAQFVPKTYDLPRQIYSWLAMPIPETWQLDGKVWLNQ